MAYASIPDVQTMVSFRSIDGQSEPRVQEVVQMIDGIAADIDVALAANGYSVPISASAVIAFAFLKQTNAYGAAMRAEAASAKGKASPHLEFLERQYNARWQQISDGSITLPDATPDITAAAPRANGIASSMFSIYDSR